MDVDAVITLAVIAIAMILFITEYFSVDLVAIGVMVVLVLTGVITPEASLQGFANSATMTVAAMFVLSAAIIKTNVIEHIGPAITRLLKKGYFQSISGIGVFVGGMSAFINNTPVVATFIPVITKAAQKANISPSRFLIPLSFAAMLGGTCTLIGTSTNLLVSGISEEHGLGAFSMFLMTPLGIIFFAVGMVYILLWGKKMIPEREALSKERNYNQIENYLTEIKYIGGSDYKKVCIKDIFVSENTKFDIQLIKRSGQNIKSPSADFELQKDDVMLVKGDLNKIKKILKSQHLSISETMVNKEFPDVETTLIEVVLQENSEITRKKLKKINFQKRYQANILAVRQRGENKFKNLDELTLHPGDVLLLQTTTKGKESIIEYQNSRNSSFLILKETHVGKIDQKKLLISSLTIAAVIALAALDIVPIVIGAFTGIVFLNLTNVITMEDAYKSIDWQVIFLLAGALSLEKAMGSSGVSNMIGDFLVTYAGENTGPVAVVSLLYIITTLITGVISNNAAAALLAPISISIAEGMGVNALPFLIAIAFAGSASFFTPVGYQTNTMVYSAGNYKFRDFTKVGLPLNLIFWVVATLLIPLLYPF